MYIHTHVEMHTHGYSQHLAKRARAHATQGVHWADKELARENDDRSDRQGKSSDNEEIPHSLKVLNCVINLADQPQKHQLRGIFQADHTASHHKRSGLNPPQAAAPYPQICLCTQTHINAEHSRAAPKPFRNAPVPDGRDKEREREE
jgi:hypothetical protein